MKLTITQIDKILWQGDADAVSVPGAAGEMTILAHHMPLITTLKQGIVSVRYGAERDEFPVTGGVVDIGKEETTILI